MCRGKDKPNSFRRKYKFMYKCVALYHVSCFARDGRAGPCHSRKSPSLPRNRLKIQRIAARYRGRRRVGWWTLVLLLIVLLNIFHMFRHCLRSVLHFGLLWEGGVIDRRTGLCSMLAKKRRKPGECGTHPTKSSRQYRCRTIPQFYLQQ